MTDNGSGLRHGAEGLFGAGTTGAPGTAMGGGTGAGLRHGATRSAGLFRPGTVGPIMRGKSVVGVDIGVISTDGFELFGELCLGVDGGLDFELLLGLDDGGELNGELR